MVIGSGEFSANPPEGSVNATKALLWSNVRSLSSQDITPIMMMKNADKLIIIDLFMILNFDVTNIRDSVDP